MTRTVSIKIPVVEMEMPGPTGHQIVTKYQQAIACSDVAIEFPPRVRNPLQAKSRFLNRHLCRS